MKIIGITIILVSCTAMGFFIDAWHKARVKELEELIYAFELLKGEIDYRLTPLIEACQMIAKTTPYSIRKLFNSFEGHLSHRELVDTRMMWEEAIKENRDNFHLTEEDYGMLGEFGQIVGHLDKEMQKRNIELLLVKLTKVKEEAKEKYNRTSKMYKGIGILVGACISIVLI